MNRHERTNFGPCCACGADTLPQNLVMLKKRAPVLGTGWGCVVCALPFNGAIAVLCDSCAFNDAPILFACDGYPNEAKRVAIASLDPGDFDHLAGRHAGEDEINQKMAAAAARAKKA